MHMKPGAKRDFEGWELVYYAAFAIAVVLTVVIVATKEDTSLTAWAQREIVRRRALREKPSKEE